MAINSDSVLYGAFGLYPSHEAGILDVVKEIYFYAVCNDATICAEYLEQTLFNEEELFLVFHVIKLFQVIF
jgi:hypothetical protein